MFCTHTIITHLVYLAHTLSLHTRFILHTHYHQVYTLLCSLSADSAHVHTHSHTMLPTQAHSVSGSLLCVSWCTKTHPLPREADTYGDTTHMRTQLSPLHLYTPSRLATWAPCPPPPPGPLLAFLPPKPQLGKLQGWARLMGVVPCGRGIPGRPFLLLASAKCLHTEKSHRERLFRLEINVTEKCGSRAINAAFFATHYLSALKREAAHFWRVFNLLGSQ